MQKTEEDYQQRIKELREQIGVNRKEFCEMFEIPYRTVTEWERGNRRPPSYVVRLLEYCVKMKQLKGEVDED